MKKLILIDAHSIIYRAYHALPFLTAPDGALVNAVYGFTAIFIKTVQEREFDFIASAFDVSATTFREKEFKDYKAQREKMPDDLAVQIPLVEKVLEVFRVPVYKKEGFEADDVIGTITKKLDREDVEIHIISGDLDILQLVNEKVEVAVPQKGIKGTLVYNTDKVFEKYGFSSSRIPDFKGLKGDASDNIPGVPGVGEKTAISLIKQYGTLEDLYENLNQADLFSRLRSKLLEYKEQAFLSKKLAVIEKRVPIEFDLQKCRWQEPGKDRVLKLFKELGFESLIKRLFQ